MRSNLFFAALPMCLAIAAASQAQVVLDGSAEAKLYGAAIAVQNTQTQFGDATQGTVDFASGSELDACYATIDGNFLFIVFAGNLESNYNKLEIFIDGVAGGQNRLRGNNPDVDFNGINRMGDDGTGNGLTFDADFSADLWISLTCGGAPLAVYMNQAQLLTEGGGTGGYLGTGGAGAAGAVIFKSGFGFGLDNSNIAGVASGTELADTAAAGLVRTGVEVRIPLSAIPGYTVGDLKVCAFINGGGHDYLSNQVLGPLGGGANLAEPRLVNLENYPGSQYVLIANSGATPCPSDLDLNGSVDAADLAALLGAWGGTGGDLDGSGTTDAADLAIMLGAWGACS